MSTAIADLKQSAPAKRERTIFDLLTSPKVEQGIKAVSTKFLTPDRFLRFAINAVKKTPLLLQCDPETVLGGFMTTAALGLEPNTVQQQAWLIPYKKRAQVNGKWTDVYECQFQIGARGFVTLGYRSPLIKVIQYEAIHENDRFEHALGSDSFLQYEKKLFNRGDLIGSFCYVRLDGGNELATVLPLDEIVRIRSKSETYKALGAAIERAENAKERGNAERKFAEQPWVLWEDDMASKSAIKKGAKQMPLNTGDALQVAADLDQDASDRVIDIGAMADPELARAVARGEEEAPALTDDPSGEAFSTMDMRAAQRETVARGEAEPAAGTPAAENRADAEASRATRESQAKKAPTVREVEDKLDAASTLDQLEHAEKLIADIPDPDAERHLREKAAALRTRFERASRGRRARPSAE